jgi:diguanylate cyclase (GGDEF)-like protein
MSTTEKRGHPALTDTQTRLPNPLHWDTVYGVVFGAAHRGIPLTLILLEMDQYLSWKEERSSEEVAGAMKGLGAALAGVTRESDLVARTDEDRFAFALLGCNLAGGQLMTERLDGCLEPFRQDVGMRFSIGVASHTLEMKRPEDLIAAAEKALRRAQARGGGVEFQN